METEPKMPITLTTELQLNDLSHPELSACSFNFTQEQQTYSVLWYVICTACELHFSLIQPIRLEEFTSILFTG